MAVAQTSTNRLRKLGAHLRMVLEEQGVNPETSSVVLFVDSEKDRQTMVDRFRDLFDPKTMDRSTVPDSVYVLGVPIKVAIWPRESV